MEEKFYASTLKLGHNLRNTQYIVNTSTAVNKNPHDDELSGYLSLEKSLPGPNNYYHPNEENFDRRILIEAVLSKYFPDNQEPVIVFVHIHNEAEVIYKWCKHYLSRKVTYISEKGNHDHSQVEDYLNHPEGVLITEPQTFRGAQARNTVYFVDSSDEIRNVILRSMSFTYIIDCRGRKKGTNNFWVPGLVEEKNLSKSFTYKPSAYQFLNRENVSEHLLVEAIINKLFDNNSEETIGVSVAVEKVKDVYNYLKLKFAETRNVVMNRQLHLNKGSIYVAEPYSFDFLHDDCTFVITILKTYGADELKDIEYLTRDLILLARSKSFLIVHHGDISKFTPHIQMEEYRLEA